MAKLIAKSAYAGLLPLQIGSNEVREIVPAAITSIAPFKSGREATDAALEAATGLHFPAPGATEANYTARVIWSGMHQAFLLGPDVPPMEGAAVTDQTDAWASCILEGPDTRDILARFSPLDLRRSAFAPGQAARTLFGHMSCVLWCEAEDRIGLMVFRSMAGSAAHELERAMRAVAARQIRFTG